MTIWTPFGTTLKINKRKLGNSIFRSHNHIFSAYWGMKIWWRRPKWPKIVVWYTCTAYDRSLKIVKLCDPTSLFMNYKFNWLSRFIHLMKLVMKEATGMLFPSKSTKNKRFRSVYGCSSRADKDLSIRLYRFLSSGKILVNIIKKYVTF